MGWPYIWLGLSEDLKLNVMIPQTPQFFCFQTLKDTWSALSRGILFQGIKSYFCWPCCCRYEHAMPEVRGRQMPGMDPTWLHMKKFQAGQGKLIVLHTTHVPPKPYPPSCLLFLWSWILQFYDMLLTPQHPPPSANVQRRAVSVSFAPARLQVTVEIENSTILAHSIRQSQVSRLKPTCLMKYRF